MFAHRKPPPPPPFFQRRPQIINLIDPSGGRESYSPDMVYYVHTRTGKGGLKRGEETGCMGRLLSSFYTRFVAASFNPILSGAGWR